MKSRLGYLTALALWMALLWAGLDFASRARQAVPDVPTTQLDWSDFFTAHILPRLPVAEEFDPPLRPPDGAGAVVSLPFMEEGHLGEDWTTARGDAALGEPVYSVADGWVASAHDYANEWGQVIFIDYRQGETRWPPFVEVMYAQLAGMEVKAGDFVRRGQRIGTVGNARGAYLAHLHWEVRQTVGLGLGPGFDDRSRNGWMNPSEFLTAHRGDRGSSPLLMHVLTKSERPGWGTDE